MAIQGPYTTQRFEGCADSEESGDDEESPEPKRARGESDDGARRNDTGWQGANSETLRNLLKRQSFGDILATLRPNDVRVVMAVTFHLQPNPV